MLNKNKLPSINQLNKWQNELDAFGPRLTGTNEHKHYCKYLKNELKQMGYDYETDKETFNKWEVYHASLTNVPKSTCIPIASVFPYSGLTEESGITSEIVFCSKKNLHLAKGKIAVIEIKAPKIPTSLMMKRLYSYQGIKSFPFFTGGPVIGSFLSLPDLQKAKENGVLAVILSWKNLPKELTKDQYLPFTLPFQDLPALWIDEDSTKQLKNIAKKKELVNLTLAGSLVETTTETIYTHIKGINPNKHIIINTHTDGPNAIEENGPVGLLFFLEYFLKENILPSVSITFIFTTGHFQLPQLGNNDRQATSKWLDRHSDLWKESTNTIAGITIEHLGVKTWKKNQETSYISPEFVYTTSKEMFDYYKNALQIVQPTLNNTHLIYPRNNIYLGEGEPLYKEKIPTISFIPGPDYLCSIQNEPQKYFSDISLMYEQLKVLLTATLYILNDNN